VTEYQARLAGSQHALARYYLDANRPADAEKALLATRQLYETLVESHGDVPEFSLELAAVDRRLSVISSRQKQHVQALRYAEDVVGALRALAERFPKRAEYVQRLAVACRELGEAQVAAGKPEGAKKAFQDAVDALEKAAAAGYFADPARRKQLLPGGPFDALRANETHRKKIDAIAAP
jgi:tetratricopeptide (TPR) repeat protein